MHIHMYMYMYCRYDIISLDYSGSLFIPPTLASSLMLVYVHYASEITESIYSGTPLNRHPSTVDTCDITDISESPDHISIDYNTFKTPQQRTPRYSV